MTEGGRFAFLYHAVIRGPRDGFSEPLRRFLRDQFGVIQKQQIRIEDAETATLAVQMLEDAQQARYPHDGLILSMNTYEEYKIKDPSHSTADFLCKIRTVNLNREENVQVAFLYCRGRNQSFVWAGTLDLETVPARTNLEGLNGAVLEVSLSRGYLLTFPMRWRYEKTRLDKHTIRDANHLLTAENTVKCVLDAVSISTIYLRMRNGPTWKSPCLIRSDRSGIPPIFVKQIPDTYQLREQTEEVRVMFEDWVVVKMRQRSGNVRLRVMSMDVAFHLRSRDNERFWRKIIAETVKPKTLADLQKVFEKRFRDSYM